MQRETPLARMRPKKFKTSSIPTSTQVAVSSVEVASPPDLIVNCNAPRSSFHDACTVRWHIPHHAGREDAQLDAVWKDRRLFLCLASAVCAPGLVHLQGGHEQRASLHPSVLGKSKVPGAHKPLCVLKKWIFDFRESIFCSNSSSVAEILRRPSFCVSDDLPGKSTTANKVQERTPALPCNCWWSPNCCCGK